MSCRKGWREPANTFYVGRPNKFGNPFPVEEHGRDESIQRYEAWIQEPEQKALFEEAKAPLRGKNLACWCRPSLPCHADVLLRLAAASFCVSGHTGIPTGETPPQTSSVGYSLRWKPQRSDYPAGSGPGHVWVNTRGPKPYRQVFRLVLPRKLLYKQRCPSRDR